MANSLLLKMATESVDLSIKNGIFQVTGNYTCSYYTIFCTCKLRVSDWVDWESIVILCLNGEVDDDLNDEFNGDLMECE